MTIKSFYFFFFILFLIFFSVVIMVFIGMDHGTTGISFCLMSDDGKIIDIFKIGREDSKSGKVSAIDELSKRVDLSSV